MQGEGRAGDRQAICEIKERVGAGPENRSAIGSESRGRIDPGLWPQKADLTGHRGVVETAKIRVPHELKIAKQIADNKTFGAEGACNGEVLAA